MKMLLITIFLIITLAIVFIYTSSSSAQENNGVIGQEANIFPRLFQRNMTCSTSDYVYNDLKNTGTVDRQFNTGIKVKEIDQIISKYLNYK